MKELVLRVAASERLGGLASVLTRGTATVFMMHRFADEEAGIPGHSLAILRETLATLRRRRYRLEPLAGVVSRLQRGEPMPAKTVCFTVDDGYTDFHRVALPIFEEFECPVTVFLPTGAVDAPRWLWWDRLFCAFEETPRSSADIELGDRQLALSWSDFDSRRRVATTVIEGLKAVRGSARDAAVERIVAALDCELPPLPPARFRLMRWDDVRDAESRGASFAPHTVSHPVLSEIPAERVAHEIAESWRRLQQETRAAVPIFCYPYGQPFSFGEREQSLVRDAGLVAAVSAHHAYVDAGSFDPRLPLARFALPRFSFEESAERCLKVASGIERMQAALSSLVGR